MKYYKITLSIVFTCLSVLFFTGCSKDDGPIKNRIGIEDVPVVTTNFETGAANVLAATIPLSTVSTFQGGFIMKLYFTGAVPPTKIEVAVRKNNIATITSTVNNNNVRVFKLDVTSLPATFKVTAAELATLFGTNVVTNDAYDFGPNIYVGTKKYDAFPSVGLGSGQGVTGMNTIGFGEFVRYYFK
jgi:hypothetical protein